MCGIPFEHTPDLFPYGIYTIPEISMAGQTEETLTANGVPYEAGIAKLLETNLNKIWAGKDDLVNKVL